MIRCGHATLLPTYASTSQQVPTFVGAGYFAISTLLPCYEIMYEEVPLTLGY